MELYKKGKREIAKKTMVQDKGYSALLFEARATCLKTGATWGPVSDAENKN